MSAVRLEQILAVLLRRPLALTLLAVFLTALLLAPTVSAGPPPTNEPAASAPMHGLSRVSEYLS